MATVGVVATAGCAAIDWVTAASGSTTHPAINAAQNSLRFFMAVTLNLKT
jgi:hypothetical protein